jgi:hypothetical protein
MNHSPEPWFVDDRLPGWVLIADANGTEIVEQQGEYEDSGWTFSRADAERIVAAVNACRGIGDLELAFAAMDPRPRTFLYINKTGPLTVSSKAVLHDEYRIRELSLCPPDSDLEKWLGMLARHWEQSCQER